MFLLGNSSAVSFLIGDGSGAHFLSGWMTRMSGLSSSSRLGVLLIFWRRGDYFRRCHAQDFVSVVPFLFFCAISFNALFFSPSSCFCLPSFVCSVACLGGFLGFFALRRLSASSGYSLWYMYVVYHRRSAMGLLRSLFFLTRFLPLRLILFRYFLCLRRPDSSPHLLSDPSSVVAPWELVLLSVAADREFLGL